MSEAGDGLAVINEGKYGVGLEGNEVSLSLLRATIRPDITSDMGQHDFCYVILPHGGDAVASRINERAFEYNVPLVKANVAVPACLQSTLADCGMIPQSVKVSEDEQQVVIRLSEQNGARGKIRFPMPVKLLNMLEDEEGTSEVVPYRPFEILTLGIPVEALKV